MKTKYRPGPWLTVPDAEKRQADARLIAAAPEMLAVLQSLMEFWDNGTPVHPGAEVVLDAKSVIAKASGGGK